MDTYSEEIDSNDDKACTNLCIKRYVIKPLVDLPSTVSTNKTTYFVSAVNFRCINDTRLYLEAPLVLRPAQLLTRHCSQLLI